MTGAPTLLFGLGAAKAGTTWLHTCLAGHPDCHFRTVKEVHFFDGIDKGSGGWYAQRMRAERARLAERLGRAEAARAVSLARRIADLDDALVLFPPSEGGIGLYLDFLTKGRGERRLVGDITPAYALLSEERLRFMAGLMPDVRFVYLMRDPVERMWSHVRMQAARAVRAGEPVAARARAILGAILRDGGDGDVTPRGDYAGTLTRLSAAVPRAKVFVEFTERLLDGGIARLCDFLGIGAAAAVPARVHEGVAVPLDPADRRALAALLRPQYDFVERAFGPLPDVWRAGLSGA